MKDQKNDCTLFMPRVTVARDTSNGATGSSRPPGNDIAPPRNASEAKSAFERLFKKSTET